MIVYLVPRITHEIKGTVLDIMETRIEQKWMDEVRSETVHIIPKHT